MCYLTRTGGLKRFHWCSKTVRRSIRVSLGRNCGCFSYFTYEILIHLAYIRHTSAESGEDSRDFLAIVFRRRIPRHT
jgi:hypothetical protein